MPADDGRSYCSTDVSRLSGDECFAGARLDPGVDPHRQRVCATQPWCCEASWGPTCVMRAEAACRSACGGRIAFARERLTNFDHSELLEPGGVEVWDFDPPGPGGRLAAPRCRPESRGCSRTGASRGSTPTATARRSC